MNPLQTFFMGIPFDFFLVFMASIVIAVFLTYYFLIQSTATKLWYLRNNYSAREYKVKESLNSAYIKVVKGKKLLKKLEVIGRPFEFQGGGLIRKRVYIAVEGIDITVNPVDDVKKDKDERMISATIAGQQMEVMTEVGAAFSENINKQGFRGQLIYTLLAAGCGSGATMLILLFFGFLK